METALHDDKELITEQVEEEEWEEATEVVALPGVAPLPEAITARAHPEQAPVVPGTLVGTDTPGAQETPVWQGVPVTSISLPPLPRLATAFAGQAPAASVDFADLHQQRIKHYKSVKFGKSVCLFGTPMIGHRTCVGDNAVIHAEVSLPPYTIVRPGTVLSHCRFSTNQVTAPAVLVFSGQPSGDLNKLRFKPGKVSHLIEFGKVHFILAKKTIVPGGVRFGSGAVVRQFDVGQTEMNNCLVTGSLHLMDPILGANVALGPDVVVEANVKISNHVVFEGNNRVKAGSVIGEFAVIKAGAVISGTVDPRTVVFPEMALERSQMPSDNAISTPRVPIRNSPGMARVGDAVQGAPHPQDAKVRKILDLTSDGDVVTVLRLPASAPRAALPTQPLATAAQYPVLQSLPMEGINHLAPTPSLWSLSAGLLSPHQQLPFSAPIPSLIPPPPLHAPLSPSMQSGSRATMAEHGLISTAPPPARIWPVLQQQGPRYRHAPTGQAPAMHGNVPGINTDTSPPILPPQPFSSFGMQKPGL